MASERVTIKDIAFSIGVSTATVSNVINGKTKKIGAETVSLVEQKLEEMGYLPRQARILMGKNPAKLIGLIINDHEKYESHPLEDGYLAKLVNSLSLEAEKRNYLLIVKLTKNIDDVPFLASIWNMSAVLVQGFCEIDYQKLKRKMHKPLIIFDGFFPSNDRYINLEVNHFEGGVVAGNYLKKMGHEKVLCLSDNNICMDNLRYEGLLSVLPKSQIMIIPNLQKERSEFYKKEYKSILAYSAVFCVSDYYALDFIKNITSLGFNVPKDISVLGFDDIAVSSQLSPSLTTISQDCKLRAQITFDLVNEAEDNPLLTKNIVIPVSVVERESVIKK
ncbi:MAG: LacI family DNA-binding transcriptional regulator [Spirochaetales bacterium]|nr:LacI family DNA-binding transcriptional regulator [Spirochaetales bacterium]